MKGKSDFNFSLLHDIHVQELAKLSSIAEEGEADEPSQELDPHSRQFLKYAKQIREIKVPSSSATLIYQLRIKLFKLFSLIHLFTF